MSCELTIKVDVCTLKGYLEGVPRLLDILGKRGIKASFFFSMGPDNSGNAIRRIFGRGFFAKLLKAPMIVQSNPDILKRAAGEGHDCGIHCWDRTLWQDSLLNLSREEIRSELEKAAEFFSDIAGAPPRSCAAPGWQVSPDSLAVQDEMKLDYASSVRGTSPFLPDIGGVAFRTLQIPTTLPTLDEMWGLGMDTENVNDRYLDLLEPGLNVHTVQAEVEGGDMSEVFVRLIDCCIDGEIAFPTLRDVALRIAAASQSDASQPDICGVEMAELPGRAGLVAIQRKA